MFQGVHGALRKSLVKVRDALKKGGLGLLSRLDVYIGSQITHLFTPVVEKQTGEKRLVEEESGNSDSHYLAWQR